MPALPRDKFDGESAGFVVPAGRLAPVLAGLFTAALLTVVANPIFTPRFATVLSLTLRAAGYVALVFGIAAGVSFFAAVLARKSRIAAAEIALRTAQAAAWLAPFLAAISRRSWFALLVWALLASEIARLAVFLSDPAPSRTPQPPPQQAAMFGLPSREYALGLASLLGSFTIQAAMLAAIGSHMLLAGLLLLAGTIALIWRGARMLRDLPRPSVDELQRRTSALLVFASILIALVWLPYVLIPGLQLGQGAAGRITWLLHLRHSRVIGNTPQMPIEKSRAGGSPVVPGAVFPGVILYPETKTHVRLIAPAPQSIGRGFTPADLSIPFDGVYWFWRSPDDQPPKSAVFRYGSPAALTFRSTDGSPLWMEAHQNLGTLISLDCCSAIEVVLENAEKQAGTVAVELTLSNTTLTDKPAVSLGIQEATLPAGVKPGPDTAQTLTFRIPREAKIRRFDELTITYRLKWWRANRSANIAIARFRLVPLR